MSENSDIEIKKDLNIDMNSDNEESSSSSSESEMEFEDKEEILAKLDSARERLKVNEIDYEAQVELIKGLRKLHLSDELRTSRERFSKMYPLSPELWMEWLKDEQEALEPDGDRKYITELFERAVKDYLSVKLWVEYICFMMGGGDPVATEEVYERGLTAAGVHFADGILVWHISLLISKEYFTKIPVEDGEQMKLQKNKIESLYKRQARVALLNMDKEEFVAGAKDWVDIESNANMIKDVEKSIKQSETRIPYETDLVNASDDNEKYEAYKRYIKFSKTKENPAFVQNVYERAVADLCLNAELWEEYVKYCIEQFPFASEIVLNVCHRSQRNCPWSSSLCDLYMRAIHTFHSDKNERYTLFKERVEKFIASGTEDIKEIIKMWMSYVYYIKLQIDFESSHEEQLQKLRNACNQASSHINQYEEDDHCDVARYLAKIEAIYEKNIEAVREIYNNEVMQVGKNYQKSYLWLEFINLERFYGNTKHARKLFRRALERVWDDFEIIGKAFLKFEKEEGTLETLTEFEKKYNDRFEIVQKRRLEEAEKDHTQNKKKQRYSNFKKEKQGNLQVSYNNTPKKNQVKDAFEVEYSRTHQNKKSFSNKKISSNFIKTEPNISPKKSHLKRSIEEEESLSHKKIKVEEMFGHGETYKHDSSNDYRTVFLSNLNFQTTDKEIIPSFESCGEIDVFRLVKDFKGRSKGYGYLVFKEGESARKALLLDRKPIDKRPVFVSECNAHKSGHKFQYANAKEEDKLFVKGLPRELDDEGIRKLFEKEAKIKDLRMVIHRNGYFKGICYVQYFSKEDAEKVRVSMDGVEVQGRNISVMISNPSAKDVPRKETPRIPAGPTGQKTRLGLGFVPRSVKSQNATKDENNSNEEKCEPKSNEDFRKMLLK